MLISVIQDDVRIAAITWTAIVFIVGPYVVRSVRIVGHSENGHLSSFRSAITPVKSRLRKGQPLDRHLTFLNRNSARSKPIDR